MIAAPNPEPRTLQVRLAFIRQATPVENRVFAAIVVSVVPAVVAFVLMQRESVAGIASGAVKE